MKSKIKTQYYIGDEWVFYKVYLGPQISDTLLVEYLEPLTQKLLSENIIDKWFFIRYKESDFHLRVRFHLVVEESIGKLILYFNSFLKNLIEENIIWDLQLATYQREVNRYGRKTISLCEEYFFNDSVLISVFLKKYRDTNDFKRFRWLFGLKIVDNALDQFGFLINQKSEMIGFLKTSFRSEFEINKSSNKEISNVFRKHRQEINLILNKNILLKEEGDSIIYNLFDDHNSKINPICKKIIELNKDDSLTDLGAIVGSFLHMSLNRLFQVRQREQETICYDLLDRYYRSKIALLKEN